MKTLTIIVLLLSSIAFTSSNRFTSLQAEPSDESFSLVDLIGTWKGDLAFQGSVFPLVFRFEKSDGEIKGFMDSPSQQAFGIPIDDLSVDRHVVNMWISMAGIALEGYFEGRESMNCQFIQSDISLPLSLRKEPKQ